MKWRLGCISALIAVAAPVLVSSSASVAQPDASLDGQSRGSSSAWGWAGSWATAVTGAEATGVSRTGFTDQTVRMLVRLTVGGEQMRVRLTNIYGEGPVTIGGATVALPNTTTPTVLYDIDPATLVDLTFNGSPTATMLKGQELLSDPIPMRVDHEEDLVVSVFLPTATGPVTWHATSRQSSFSGPGDLTDTPGSGYTIGRTCCWFFLSGIDVLRRKSPGSIVVLSDSMGDANGSTLNANTRWANRLAARLIRRVDRAPGVLNTSLAGNRLNHEGNEPGAGGFPGFVQLGPNTGARLDEDVFAQTDAETVIMHVGINDIWLHGDSAESIINSIRQVGAQVRERGLRFVVATLGPYEGYSVTPGVPAGEWTPEKDATRNAVNQYLRTQHEFDGVIDFDAVLRDPAQPSRLRAEFDSGDHIHPNDAGNQAMADSIKLRVLGF